ncbi:MAG: hypothetical protein WAX04_08915 [Oscillospiraceae bacterium]
MKTDREFLDGIYQKAKLMQESEPPKSKIRSFTLHKKILVAAAAFILVAIPSTAHFNQQETQVPATYSMDAPMAIRSLNVLDVETLAANAELIVVGKVTKIEKNIYDKDNSSIITTVKVKPTEILKGATDAKLLDIKVKGGYDEETKTFDENEITFKRSENVLVFLEQDTDGNSYIVSESSQGKYTYLNSNNDVKSYIGPNNITITISELKEKLLKGE